ncbi:hypothetical protein ONS96_003215 [Cadophora gregata f. sp. sojae]|nr:hypothetical protein ONS96_003215 [Cadophora gregata f. sp. sojae]
MQDDSHIQGLANDAPSQPNPILHFEPLRFDCAEFDCAGNGLRPRANEFEDCAIYSNQTSVDFAGLHNTFAGCASFHGESNDTCAGIGNAFDHADQQLLHTPQAVQGTDPWTSGVSHQAVTASNSDAFVPLDNNYGSNSPSPNVSPVVPQDGITAAAVVSRDLAQEALISNIYNNNNDNNNGWIADKNFDLIPLDIGSGTLPAQNEFSDDQAGIQPLDLGTMSGITSVDSFGMLSEPFPMIAGRYNFTPEVNTGFFPAFFSVMDGMDTFIPAMKVGLAPVSLDVAAATAGVDISYAESDFVKGTTSSVTYADSPGLYFDMNPMPFALLAAFNSFAPNDEDAHSSVVKAATSGLLGPPPHSARPVQRDHRIRCNFPNCNRSFGRTSDLTRHTSSVHCNIPARHLCPIPGCIKSQGSGYKRADKVTEHLWKKHANLGYTKA